MLQKHDRSQNAEHRFGLKYPTKSGEGSYVVFADGPWVGEPDRKEFVHRGYPCLVLRNPEMKNLCGYVGVKQDHPAYRADDCNLDVSIFVHGGLTFAAEGDGEIRQKGFWWLGFDCAHLGDLIPGMPMFPELLEQFGPSHHNEDVYRNFEYVEAECRQLADQLEEYRKSRTFFGRIWRILRRAWSFLALARSPIPKRGRG